MRTWLNMFMPGRNGVDFFNRHLFRIAAVFAAVNLLLLHQIGSVPVIIAIYALFRTLSRNVIMRKMEDLTVRGFYDRIRGKIAGALLGLRQSRDYRFFSCPDCGSRLRVPRGKGRIQIACPRCGQRFNGRS